MPEKVHCLFCNNYIVAFYSATTTNLQSCKANDETITFVITSTIIPLHKSWCNTKTFKLLNKPWNSYFCKAKI